MDRVHRSGTFKFNERAKSPQSPISLKKGFSDEVNASVSDATQKRFAKPPRGQSPLSKSPSLLSNQSKKFSRMQSQASPKSKELLENGEIRADLGPFLLKQARSQIADSPNRALQSALRASKCFEKSVFPNLDHVLCLHVIAAIFCKLEHYDEALPVLKRAIDIPVIEEGHDHALAKFSGYMQLGDTYAMLGQIENSVESYSKGLEVQKHTLGENDSRIGDTCRYIAEAHMQALQFDKAERLCLEALQIHRDQEAPGSLDEMADRRLLGLICDTRGDHEAALEHLILASMGMISNGQNEELASVDCSIGDAYLSLARYDEAVLAYQKALTTFKSTKGENHPTVASVIVRLANLYTKIGKFRDSKSYCESALRIYEKPLPGTPPEEIASGVTELSAIYESMNEHHEAIKLLKKALNIYNNSPGQKSAIAGIEAQIGVLHYMTENYSESYNYFNDAVEKLRMCGEKKPAYFGLLLNHMGLACVQQNAIVEATELFEEAKSIIEKDYGPCHPETLGVCSNLAGTYDAMGRLDKAIEILEHVLRAREEELGTAVPDVDDEKRRLSALLKEAGRTRHMKTKSLEQLLYPSKIYRKR